MWDAAPAMILRPATSEDLPEIKRLLDAAFAPSLFESTLVELIMNRTEAHHDWVAQSDSTIAGFISYTVATHDSVPIGWHLAPLAVHPEFQRQGVGSQLVTTSLQSSPLKDQPVFVLGDPHFYERFGFKALENPDCPYDPGNAHFRALRWPEPAETFVVGYSPAFHLTAQQLGQM
jgi:putative acetyltransferase